jgi:hypothetical protein
MKDSSSYFGRTGKVALLCMSGFLTLGHPLLASSRVGELLARTGQTVAQFWEQIPNYTCRELVTREKIEKQRKIIYKQNLEFNYLALTRMQDEGLTVEEQRLLLKKRVAKSDAPSLLETNGFPTLQLIFHPHYQTNYMFQIEEDSAENRGGIRIRFEHIRGAASTSAVMIQGRAYALDLQGTAWIDAQSGAIQKISAGLMSPIKEINVTGFTAEVTYAPQSFPLEHESRWLPSKVMIELHTGLQHWRNTHQYSQYKRFVVESREAGAPGISPVPDFSGPSPCGESRGGFTLCSRSK